MAALPARKQPGAAIDSGENIISIFIRFIMDCIQNDIGLLTFYSWLTLHCIFCRRHLYFMALCMHSHEWYCFGQTLPPCIEANQFLKPAGKFCRRLEVAQASLSLLCNGRELGGSYASDSPFGSSM